MKTYEILNDIFEYFLTYKKSKMFSLKTQEDIHAEYSIFLENVRCIHKQDPDSFLSAISAAIETPCELFFTEEKLIQLECVQVFGKDHFRKFLFELCFILELKPQKMVSLFFQKTDDLKKNKEAHAKFDVNIYTGFLQHLALNPDRFSNSIRRLVWEELRTRIPYDMAEMEAFLLLAKENKIKVPKKCQLLFLASVANATISIDGLLWWYLKSKKKVQNAFRDTLNTMKAEKTIQVYLSFCDMYEKSFPLTEESKKRLVEIEDAFFDAYIDEGVEEKIILLLREAISAIPCTDGR